MTAVKLTRKAGKRVGKALSTFERAADQLERASAEHLLAVDKLEAEIDARTDAATDRFVDELARATEVFNAELETVYALCDLVDATEDEALNAQVQADNLRALVAGA